MGLIGQMIHAYIQLVKLIFKFYLYVIAVMLIMGLSLQILSWVSSIVHADDWTCRSQASEKRGSAFYSCGVAEAPDENTARLQALDNAKKEFFSLCQSSSDCIGHSFDFTPGRTECVHQDLFICYRMLVIEPSREVNLTHGHIQPYFGKNQTIPEVRIGMTKKELLEKFGAPVRIQDLSFGDLLFSYEGEMCQRLSCFAVLNAGRIESFQGFKPEYTDLLK